MIRLEFCVDDIVCENMRYESKNVQDMDAHPTQANIDATLGKLALVLRKDGTSPLTDADIDTAWTELSLVLKQLLWKASVTAVVNERRAVESAIMERKPAIYVRV